MACVNSGYVTEFLNTIFQFLIYFLFERSTNYKMFEFSIMQ